MKYRALLFVTALAQLATRAADKLSVVVIRVAEASNDAVLAVNSKAYQTRCDAAQAKARAAREVTASLSRAYEQATQDQVAVGQAVNAELNKAFAKHREVFHNAQ